MDRMYYLAGLFNVVYMELFAEEVGQLEETVRQHPAGSVVFYGSSTIRRWTHLTEDFPQTHVLNLGFGGSTLAACGWYFERLVVPARPRAIVLYAGDNDLGEDRQPEEVYLFFCALADKMLRHLPGVPLTFVAIKPSPARWSIVQQIRAANAAIAGEIERLPNAQFIDLSPLMLNERGEPRRELYEDDGLHLTPAGYAFWREQLTERVDALHP